VLLDTATGKPLSDVIRVGESVHEGAVHPQGVSFLAVSTSSPHEAQLWDLSTGKKVGQPMRHPEKCGVPAFSPDGTIVATTCWDGLVRFWDSTTGQPIRAPIDVGVGLNSIAFSQDGTRIATTGRDRTVSIWDLASSRRISGPLLHNQSVWRLAFSPNAEFVAVASGAWEKTAPGTASVTVWSVSMGRMVARWEHPHHVTSVAFRPDGKAVASSCFDGNVRVWPLPEPILGEPEQLELWAEVMTGMTFQSSGASTPLDGKTFESQKRRLQQLGGS
jgi:WD40 repeat protein